MTSTRSSTISTKKLHVLHFASGDLWAGAEVMLYTLTKTLHLRSDTRISAVILNHGELEHKLRKCGIEVHVIDELSNNSLQVLIQLNRIIVELAPDVIHTHRLKENILGSFSAWFNGRIPSLRTLHGAPEHPASLYQLPKKFIQSLDWLSARFYQKTIVAVSPALATQLEQYYPVSKITMIENGIDVKSLAPEGLQPHQQNSNQRYHIGIAGRLSPVKRVDLFIDCAVYLKSLKPQMNIHFHIYGNGPLNNDLRAQVQNSQAESYIHFEGLCNDIPQKLKTLDALLMTSDHEGLPMILLEAMCLNTNIIAHAVGGIPNLLDNGKCGTLMHDLNAQAFAEAILAKIEQPTMHQKMAADAFKRVQQNYSAELMAKKYLAIYKSMTAKH